MSGPGPGRGFTLGGSGEESSVIHVRPLSEDIFPGNSPWTDIKAQNASHHLNLTSPAEAREGDALSMKADEAAWHLVLQPGGW